MDTQLVKVTACMVIRTVGSSFIGQNYGPHNRVSLLNFIRGQSKKQEFLRDFREKKKMKATKVVTSENSAGLLRRAVGVSLVGFCNLYVGCGQVSGCEYELCRSAQCGKERLAISDNVGKV